MQKHILKGAQKETTFSIIHKHDFLIIIHKTGANWLLVKSSCSLFAK